MLLNISNISQEPLHAQISRQIRAKILSGTFKKDDMLPSIRGMAGDLKVSVITTQKAYDDLMHEGLIHSRHGKGYFVNLLTAEKKKELSLERLVESIEPSIKDSLEAGLSPKEIYEAIKMIFENKE